MNIFPLKKWHDLLKSIFVFCISSFIFILTMEVSARIDDRIKYNAPLWGEYNSEILITYDNEGIRHNVPGIRYEKWEINELGFRGPSFQPNKPEGIFRIICMGTSETFGLDESPGKEWPSQLSEFLMESKKFQVVNASVVGLSLKDYIPYIEKYVLRLNPDIIILYVNPFYYSVGVDNFVKKQSDYETNSRIYEKNNRQFLDALTPNPRIFSKIKQTIKKIIPSRLLRHYQISKMSKQIMNLEKKRLKGRRPIDTISKENLEAFQSDMVEIIRYLHQRKIYVILTTYPSLISSENISKYPEIFLDFRRFFIELSLEGLIEASMEFNNMIKIISAEYGTGFVDNAIMVPKDLLYFADNVHYTNEGARLIASNFSSFINTHFKGQ